MPGTDIPDPVPCRIRTRRCGNCGAHGHGVEKFKAGDRVVMVFPSCGTCVYCINGKPAYCLAASRLKNFGTRADGSTVMTRGGRRYSAAFFSSLPSPLMPGDRAQRRQSSGGRALELLAAFPCGINTGAGAVRNVLHPQPGMASPSLASAQSDWPVDGRRIAGCDPIIAIDLHPNRLALATSLGATHTINAASSDPIADIHKVTGGLGVRASLEAAGSPRPCVRR